MITVLAGGGGLTIAYAEQLGGSGRFELAAAADERPEAAEVLANQLGITVYSSKDQMLAEVGPQLVCWTGAAADAAKWLVPIAAAGAALAVEQPLGGSLAEADHLIEACRRHSVRLYVRQAKRYSPEHSMLQQLVKGGGIGRPGVVHVRWSGPLPEGRSAQGGLVQLLILERLIEELDYLHGLFGEVNNVYASGRELGETAHVLITLRFAGGVMANIQGYWSPDGESTGDIEIAGTSGILVSGGNDRSLVLRRQANPPVSAYSQPGCAADGLHVQELERWLTGDAGAAAAQVVQARTAMLLAMAALESIDSGRPVRPGRQTDEREVAASHE